MRQLFAVALVLGVVALPACAQHGGGGHGGGSGGLHGGYSGRPAFAGHGGVTQAGSARYASGSGARYGAQGYGPAGHLSAPGFYGSRPVFYTRGRVGHPYGRRFGSPYVYPVPLEGGYLDGELGYGLLDNDYSDSGYPDNDGYYNDSANGPVEDLAAQGQGYDAGQQGPGYPATGAAEEGAPAAAAMKAQVAAPSLYDSGAVTLVFKDGRPLETIHNYALTRTTLYVTDAHRQEIPVADLDLAATEKANREAGVNFQLPVAGR